MSETQEKKEPSFLRHAAFFGPNIAESYTIVVVGTGAVGSWTAMTLARMGCTKFKLIDFDEVAAHNLPNQAFFAEDIGMKKIEALTKNLKNFNPNVEVTSHDSVFSSDLFDLNSGEEYIVVMATDSFASRRDVATWVKGNLSVCGLYGVRLGFEFGRIDYYNPMSNFDMSRLEVEISTKDEDVEEGPCNRKICGTLVMIASAALAHFICEDMLVYSSGSSPDRTQHMTHFVTLEKKLTVNHLGVKPQIQPRESSS